VAATVKFTTVNCLYVQYGDDNYCRQNDVTDTKRDLQKTRGAFPGMKCNITRLTAKLLVGPNINKTQHSFIHTRLVTYKYKCKYKKDLITDFV